MQRVNAFSCPSLDLVCGLSVVYLVEHVALHPRNFTRGHDRNVLPSVLSQLQALPFPSCILDPYSAPSPSSVVSEG